MRTNKRSTAALLAAAALATFVVLCAQALAARSVSPLPASDYSVRSVCADPTPGHAGCMSLQLVPETAAARAHTHPLGMTRATATATAGRSGEVCELPTAAEGCFGLRPQDVHSAYRLPTNASGTQTVALVDAFNDPNAERDLETYDREFGLPQCTKADGCFRQVNQSGETTSLPFPTSEAELKAASKGSPAEREKAREAEGWSIEISLDVESAHATCQNCHIALVEASSSAYDNLEAAEESAVRLHADEVSNSWGGPECEEDLGCLEDSSTFDHPGTVITASAGDDGYLNWLEAPQSSYANYPASSPHVVAVGGTRLLLGEHGEWAGESVWNDGGENKGVRDGHGAGGGGCSIQFAAPPWQQRVLDWSSVGCAGKRAVADVSADADPYTGLAVYDTSPECKEEVEEENSEGDIVETTVHWCTIGGTSLASPLIASVFALAGGAEGVDYPAQTLYENAAQSPSSLHDVTEGSNGRCRTPFDGGTASPSCTTAEEAASCSSRLICVAGTGYDGPTGVGTPDGITAFQPTAEELSGIGEEGESEGEGKAPSKPKAKGRVVAPAPAPAPGATTPVTVIASPSPQIGGLALTLKALIALDKSRPKIGQIGFTFLSNANMRVLAALQKRVSKRRHTHWQTLTHPLAITAAVGRNNGRLGGHGGLGSGTYRLTLVPAHGAARSIVFKIG
jgi:Subtilase family